MSKQFWVTAKVPDKATLLMELWDVRGALPDDCTIKDVRRLREGGYVVTFESGQVDSMLAAIGVKHRMLSIEEIRKPTKAPVIGLKELVDEAARAVLPEVQTPPEAVGLPSGYKVVSRALREDLEDK